MEMALSRLDKWEKGGGGGTPSLSPHSPHCAAGVQSGRKTHSNPHHSLSLFFLSPVATCLTTLPFMKEHMRVRGWGRVVNRWKEKEEAENLTIFFSRIDYGKGSNPSSPLPFLRFAISVQNWESLKKKWEEKKKRKVKKCFLPWLLLSSLFRRFPLSPHSQQKKVHHNILPNIEEKVIFTLFPARYRSCIETPGGIQVCTNWGGCDERGKKEFDSDPTVKKTKVHFSSLGFFFFFDSSPPTHFSLPKGRRRSHKSQPLDSRKAPKKKKREKSKKEVGYTHARLFSTSDNPPPPPHAVSPPTHADTQRAQLNFPH